MRREPSDALRLTVIRGAIPVGGLIAVVAALNAQVVFDTVLDANMLMLAAVIAPFILGVWWQKANRAGALVSMAAGIVAWISDLAGFAVSLVTMLIATPLTQRIDPPRRLVDHDGNEVALDDRLGVLRS